MTELSEPTIAMAFGVVGVIGTLIWYALAWYGISIGRDLREAIGSSQSPEPSNPEEQQ